MSDALVGHTGFVGGNLLRQMAFDDLYSSRDIGEIDGKRFDRLVVSAVPAAMFLANSRPEQDLANIRALFAHLATVEAKQVVLISTIAVYADPAAGPDEDSGDYEQGKAYGRHRRLFETMLSERFPDLLIVRLPALFGPGLAKNFVFDLLNPVPSFLNEALHGRLADAAADDAGRALVDSAFAPDAATGLWKFDRAMDAERAGALEALCRSAGIDARNFTNSDSRFQFYSLDRLGSDIESALDAALPSLNLATEPVAASAVAARLTGETYANTDAPAVSQDMRSRHAPRWGRTDGYLYGATQVLADLAAFYAVERAA